jgi:hypothetical protein
MRKCLPLSFVLLFAVCSAHAQTASQKVSGAEREAPESTATETSLTLRDAEPEYKPPSGYKKTKVNSKGEVTYCKKEQVIGTRFPKTYCYTQMQLEQLESQNEEVRRDVSKSQQTQGSWDPFGG